MTTLEMKISRGKTAGASFQNRLRPLVMLSLALPFCLAAAPPNKSQAGPSIGKAEKRLANATIVLRESLSKRESFSKESLSKKDKHTPAELLSKADCVGVFPSVWKGALIIGGRYGQGFVTCRLPAGGWSGPASFRIEGGSIGLQIGGAATDLVLLFHGADSMSKLLRTKFTLGVDTAVAAGPVGRTSSIKTDTLFASEITGYSRSRGAFAGIALDGATMRPIHKTNRRIYGFEPLVKNILRGQVDPPASTRPLLDLLGEYSHTKQVSD